MDAFVREVRNKGSRIWRGAMTLTAAALLVKVMSVTYRLLYQNFAGDVGFYVYQQIYPFYAIAVAIGGTGFPIVIAKYLAESEAGGWRKQQILHHALIALLILCSLLFFLLFFVAGPLTKAMGDKSLEPLIRFTSTVYLFVPLIAVLRGYFQGRHENMLPTAVSQISEQMVRVLLIIGLSWYLFLHHGTPYQFGLAATAGSVIAPVSALVILMCFAGTRPLSRLVIRRSTRETFDGKLLREILETGCLFSILAMPLIAFQLADALTLIPLLGEAGVPDPRVAKGVYDRGYLLTQFGLIAAASLTATMIPGLARLTALKSRKEMQRQAGLALRLSLAFGLAAAAGLASLGKEVNIMLFRNAEGTPTFMLIAFVMMTLSVVLTSSGILEASGRPWLPFWHLLTGAIVKCGSNLLLVPLFSVSGAAVATLLATALTAWLNIWALRRFALLDNLPVTRLARLVGAVFIMVLTVWLWKSGIGGLMPQTRGSAAVVAVSGSIAGGLLFLVLLLLFRYFSPTDLIRLPLAGKHFQNRRKHC
ncbi:oligosaccharide flippase family protein [Sporolactobacillus sp. THM19-2]|uniref:oligosaccharide flippase family protein n=1 Tax=Sporolactobacillus sp. THM19-2 TaxID=2511171 RepID=UPI001F0FF8AB|nr:polysaccharide biosynthesis protein [Sporolactobacillus sp. THM19-2]